MTSRTQNSNTMYYNCFWNENVILMKGTRKGRLEKI